MAGRVRDRQGPGHEGLGGYALGQEPFSEASQGDLVKHPFPPHKASVLKDLLCHFLHEMWQC